MVPPHGREEHLNGKTANASRSRMHEHNIPLSNMEATVKRAISSKAAQGNVAASMKEIPSGMRANV
jgi:hypothetical protein